MAAKLLEITGIFLGERMRWGETILAQVDCRDEKPGTNGSATNGGAMGVRLGGTTIKGPAEPDELQPHQTYRFYGQWNAHPKYGQQFAFQTFVRSQPHGRGGVIRYLQRAPHVGQAIAERLWEKFGGDAVRVVRESPEVASAAVGGQFGEERAQAAAAYLASEARLESTSIELIDLLGGRGFPRNTAKKAIARWGNRAAEMIRRSPYLLMAFRGCGFLRTDAMYLQLGLPPAKRKRQAYAAWYALASDTDGHTWHTVEKAVEGIRARVAGATIDPPSALLLAKRAGLIATRRDEHGKLWVADGKKADAESRVAQHVAEAQTEHATWPMLPEDCSASEHQRERLALATAGMIGCFGGSPGTGKTFTAALLAREILAAHGSDTIAVAAPTGKAAVRITEAMQSYGVPVQATTIHRLLKVAQCDVGDGWGFEHDADNPLPHRFILVDESSMIDTSLLASLLAARAKGTHVLLIGDVNQLPPVGHGAPLRDLISVGLPYGELREIRRNSGTIVRACAQIRDGQTFEVDEQVCLEAEPAKNLKVVAANGPPAQTAKMLAAIDASKSLGLDPVWDCQVLVPVNAKSPLARKELNKLLQRELNKTGQKAPGNPFLVGDKIVNTKNGFFPIDEERCPAGVEKSDDGKVFVANGELAEVIEVAEKLTTAKLSGPTRVIKIPRGSGKDGDGSGNGDDDKDDEKTTTGCAWDLGYSLSVHKSQGSEWPVVIVMLDEYPGARMVCSREWLYTGISRAKKLCLLVGRKSIADGMCRRLALSRRKTFLTELVKVEDLAAIQGGPA